MNWANYFAKASYALSLAVGVSLLLSVLFDSGLFSDPAIAKAGRHASADEIGLQRVQSGRYLQFKPTTLQLRLSGPLRRLILNSDGEDLYLNNHLGEELWRFSTLDRTIENVFFEWVLHEKGLLNVEIIGDTSPKLAASGLAVALTNSQLYLDAGSSVVLSWAEPASKFERLITPSLRLLSFDFGNTLSGRPIIEQLMQKLPRSLAIAAPAYLLTLAISLWLAMLCARRGGAIDKSMRILASLGMSLSAVVWVMMCQQFFAGTLGWFPVFGWQTPLLKYASLPILTWLLVGVWPQWLFWRTQSQEFVDQDFLRSARARGLTKASTFSRHLFAMLAPRIAVQSLGAIPFLMLGSLLLERFFGIPGLGSLTADAVRDGDIAVLRATSFLIALLFLFTQLLSDWAVTKLDPRAGQEASQ